MADDAKFFYANSMELAVSGYDVSIRFVRNQGRIAGQKVLYAASDAIVEEVDSMTVCVSPSYAKALLPGLIDAMRNYEKTFGVVPLPAEAQAAWNRTVGKIGD